MTKAKLSKLSITVSNDISEGIDNGETREQLRQVVKEWVTVASQEAARRAVVESNLQLCRAAKKLMDAALKEHTAK